MERSFSIRIRRNGWDRGKIHSEISPKKNINKTYRTSSKNEIWIWSSLIQYIKSHSKEFDRSKWCYHTLYHIGTMKSMTTGAGLMYKFSEEIAWSYGVLWNMCGIVKSSRVCKTNNHLISYVSYISLFDYVHHLSITSYVYSKSHQNYWSSKRRRLERVWNLKLQPFTRNGHNTWVSFYGIGHQMEKQVFTIGRQYYRK